MRRIAVLLVFGLGGCELLADVDCLAGDTAACPPAPVDLVDLSADGIGRECDFLTSFPVETVDCGGGRTATSGGLDQASCLARLASIPRTCTATTADLETCATSTGDDPCQSPGTDECRALATCGL